MDHAVRSGFVPASFIGLVFSIGLCVTARAAPVQDVELSFLQKLQNPAPTFDDRFGGAVAIDAGTLVIGAPRDNVLGTDSGAAYVYVEGGTSWTLQQTLTASDGTQLDELGCSVAIEGDRIVVGARETDTCRGAAYVFERSGPSWVETAKLSASDATVCGLFGAAVDLEGDTILVGAPTETGLFADKGAAYVFRRAGPSWVQEAKLFAPDETNDSHAAEFGAAVALHGQHALCGAPAARIAGEAAGAAYTFRFDGSTWAFEQKLTTDDGDFGDRFGASVDLDGDRAVVGAPLENPPALSGATYVYRFFAGAWFEEDRLRSLAIDPFDQFGMSVAILGERILVGSPELQSGDMNEADRACFFAPIGTRWEEMDEITPSDAATLDHFGTAVALRADLALIGAFLDDLGGVQHAGSAYLYFIYPSQAGEPHCFGDGSILPCPCANAGGPGEGCENSSGAGALLQAFGSSEIIAADLSLRAAGAKPSSPALFFQGASAVALPLADGIRCAGPPVIRLETVTVSAGGIAESTAPIAFEGGVSPGDVRHYQLWYRDVSGPCGFGSNLSSAVRVEWH